MIQSYLPYLDDKGNYSTTLLKQLLESKSRKEYTDIENVIPRREILKFFV